MAIAAVASQNGGNVANNTTAVTRAFGSNVQSGSLIVVVGAKWSPTNTAFTAGNCTRSAGTATLGTIALARQLTFDPSGGSGSGYLSIGIWHALVTGAGSATMRVATGASGSYLLMGTHEFTGNWDATREEGGNQASSTTDASTSGSSGSATSAGAALFVGGIVLDGNSALTITQDGAFSLVYEQEAAGSQVGSVIYQIVGAGTTDAADWTFGTGHLGYAAAVQVFREVSGGGGGSPVGGGVLGGRLVLPSLLG